MIAIIMAGGLGKRMNSDLPKVLHHVKVPHSDTSLPMIVHVILKAQQLNIKKIFIIVGKYKNIIEDTINCYSNLINISLIHYVTQNEPLGTGHAVACVLPHLLDYINDNALILSGDVPLMSESTLNALNGEINKLLITDLDNPHGCGRIIFDNDYIVKIVEEKDCTEEQRLIKYVNCGIYQIKVQDLLNLIPSINNNNKSGEYYLTDIVELMVNNNIKLGYYCLPKEKHYEIKNVNTKQDLDELNNYVDSMT